LNHNGTGVISGRRAAITPLLLWALTLLLWLPWLGNQPLRDWDEGLVATVSRSTVSRATDALLAFKWDAAYLNKPPGLHWLIGGAVQHFGEADGVVRLVPCLLSSLAVPLIYWLRCGLNPTPATPDERRQRDRRALMAALILMTLLPMARHGRLAMLDGTLVSCSPAALERLDHQQNNPMACPAGGAGRQRRSAAQTTGAAGISPDRPGDQPLGTAALAHPGARLVRPWSAARDRMAWLAPAPAGCRCPGDVGRPGAGTDHRGGGR